MNEGVIAVMAGTGFELGGGFVGAADPPPQPVTKQMQDKRQAARTHVARFIDVLCMKQTEFDTSREGNRKHHTCLYSLHKYFMKTFVTGEFLNG